MESPASVSVGQGARCRLPQEAWRRRSRVPDPRRAPGVAYPPAAVLSLAVAAILAKQLSELAIAQRRAAADRAAARPGLPERADPLPIHAPAAVL